MTWVVFAAGVLLAWGYTTDGRHVRATLAAVAFSVAAAPIGLLLARWHPVAVFFLIWSATVYGLIRAPQHDRSGLARASGLDGSSASYSVPTNKEDTLDADAA